MNRKARKSLKKRERLARRRFNCTRADYVTFCAHNVDEWEVDGVRVAARKQFEILCGLSWISQVAINVHKKELYVGTTLVCLPYIQDGTLRKIGEFIITISKHPIYFRFENITQSLVTKKAGETVSEYLHPHISGDGSICMTQGRDTIHTDLAHGDVLHAVQILGAALYTLDAIPFQGALIQHWPIYNEEEGF